MDIRPLQLRCFLITTLLRWDRERGLPGSQRTAVCIKYQETYRLLVLQRFNRTHMWWCGCDATLCVSPASFWFYCREKPDRRSRGGLTRRDPPGSRARRRWRNHKTGQTTLNWHRQVGTVYTHLNLSFSIYMRAIQHIFVFIIHIFDNYIPIYFLNFLLLFF